MNIIMSTKNTKEKVNAKSQQVKESVVEVKEPEPVVETKQTQKRDGKKSTKQTEPVVEVKEPEPVVETKQTQKRDSKKSTKQTEPVVEEVRQTQVKDEDEVEVVGDEEDNEHDNKLRYFKLFFNNEYKGRYCGKKPKQAANKAFSSIIKNMKKNLDGEGIHVDINFSIRECTRNSRHKEYNYVGFREQLDKHVEVEIINELGNVKTIVYGFKNKISKAPKVQVQV